MTAVARPFTASGQIRTGETEVTGLVFKGFTAVTVYDGTDNTGKVVVHASAAGTYTVPQVRCDVGVYVEVTGAGKGSLLT